MMSSTEDTRPSCRAYWAVSIRIEPAAATARIREVDASAGNRIGARRPSATKPSRFPTI